MNKGRESVKLVTYLGHGGMLWAAAAIEVEGIGIGSVSTHFLF